MDKANKDSFNLFQLKKELENSGILLTYKGPINQDLLKSLLELVHKKMENEAKSSIVTKIITIFIEQIQNVMSYSNEREYNEETLLDVGVGICVLAKEKDHYYLMAGNQIDLKQKEFIKERLDKICSMNQNELKAYFKEQRKKPHQSTKGAGLGLIDMARKSDKTLFYDFHKIDKNNFFFTLKVYIKAGE